MDSPVFEIKKLTLEPDSVHLYVPPIVWKGDNVGHIGIFDVFFFVIEGECFLKVEGQSYIVRKGQLAFLPKGKSRRYTQSSKNFSMYEFRFDAESDGENLMSAMGLSEGELVVSLPDPERVRRLFEESSREELFLSPIYHLSLTSSLLDIIRLYCEERIRQRGSDTEFFQPVIEYMTNNMTRDVKLSDLSSTVYMHPTYFVKRFGKCFGMPPLAYLNRLRIYHAMERLTATQDSIEDIARSSGIPDSSYFARVFKKYTGTSPTEYRTAFKR